MIGENFMSSETGQFGTALHAEVDIKDPAAIERWTEHWCISEVELRKAIAEVGTNATDLSIILGKAPYGSSDLHQAAMEGGSGYSAPA